LKSNLFFIFTLVFFLITSCFHEFCCAESNPTSIPARFPDLIFQNSLSKEEQVYLGIKDEDTFSINDIKGTLTIVELTNTYCVSCQKNIKILNEIYKQTQNNKNLKGKIKVMGVAIGNNKREVNYFKNEHKILYPLINDPEFVAHKALGEPRVPYTMFVRRNAKGEEIIFKIHKGAFESADNLMNEINNICSGNFQ
jgi:hypothetical protein